PGPRPCDAWAREQLGAKRSSIFTPPVRPTIEGLSPGDTSSEAYREACTINQQHTGKKISKQAFFISFKIKEADQWLQAYPEAQKVVGEAHPELAFLWLKGQPLLHKKKATAGQTERMALLRQPIPDTPQLIAEARKRFLKKQVANDDLLDAL
ncbi:MAG TPA: DUF429 domain-containing protein, partial [Cytophagales bacterium]|nr:DUF429 domain-containing protein [Cytophagales bacterium]